MTLAEVEPAIFCLLFPVASHLLRLSPFHPRVQLSNNIMSKAREMFSTARSAARVAQRQTKNYKVYGLQNLLTPLHSRTKLPLSSGDYHNKICGEKLFQRSRAMQRRSFASSQPLQNDDEDNNRTVSQQSQSSASRTTETISKIRKENISKKDMVEEESKRWRLSDVPISTILQAKHNNRWVDPVISRTATLKEAVEIVIDGGLSAAMVTDEQKRVVGLVTSRDLLRCMAIAIKDGDSPSQIFDRTVDHVLTPISQVIYARPMETVGMCRTIMAKLGIKCLPVLSNEGRVEGLVTSRDISQYRFSAEDKGGKKSYLNDVSERVGLSTNTSMADPPAFMQAHLALEQKPLFVNLAVAELPHPYKTDDGVGMNRRGKAMSRSRNLSYRFSFPLHPSLDITAFERLWAQ